MTTLYFFGDSWPAEGPLEGKLEVIPSYPTIVGDILELNVVNCSVSSSSQLDMIQQLLNSNIQPGDIAVFSLTAQSRQFYYDNFGKPVNVSNPEKMTLLDAVNDYNGVWQSAQTCFILYNICQQWNVTPCFLNTFNISYHKDYHHKLWELIPDNCWIMPKNKCVVEEFDVEFFNQFKEYRNSDFTSWLDTNNKQVQHYIRPYKNHPYINGRQKIAVIIANYLRRVIRPRVRS
jgi:hypothetical protein